MPNYANATIVGHVGRDPEMRYLPDGKAVAQFSVATTRKVKGNGQTTWWRVSAFGRTAEVAGEYVKKGAPVLISGEPMLREYTTDSGEKRSSLEITADRLTLLGRKGDGGEQREERPVERETQRAAPLPKGGGIEDMDSDLPF